MRYLSPSRLLHHTAALACLVIGYSAVGANAADADPALIKAGEYLMRAGDCIACHTGPSGKPFAGGLEMATPVGIITTPNITPDVNTGIGAWSDDQFYRALHEGIGHKGEYLYPAFPFPWYTKMTRPDVLAVKAYLFSLPPVDAPRKPLKMSFPFNVREALLAWRTSFFKAAEFKPDPAKSAEVNRGAYLVEGPGHCGECHNHANVMGASDWSGRLQGGVIDGWYAPNITSSGAEGIGRWKTEDLVSYLKTGTAPGKGVAIGPMMETINDSLKYLSDQDLHAIAAYLKSFGPEEKYKQTDDNQASLAAAQGGSTYLAFCASCHGVEGQGRAGMIPALAGNGSVAAQGPQNIIRAVLGGLEASSGMAPMPAFGVTMTDQQIADVANYVRTAWGNGAPANAEAGMIATLRPKSKTPMSVTTANECTSPVAGPVLAKAIADSGLIDSVKAVPLANMLGPIDDALPKIKAGAPDAKLDEIVNAMTVAYCPIAMASTNVSAPDKAILLGNFASLVYGQARMAEHGTPKN